MKSLLTIAELPEYIRRAEKLMSASERLDIINYLAVHPKAGDLMEGTGGIRKLRWGRGAQGKSGGVRVIYYVHSEQMPLYLLTLFAKMNVPTSAKLSVVSWQNWSICWCKFGLNRERKTHDKCIQQHQTRFD